MYKNLENYLEDISQYLSVKGDTKEILSEIKSHILEKAEHEFGEITESSIGKTITNYGSPRNVAEKYIEGLQVIAPSLRKHLFLYTGILFAVHFSLTIISLLFHIRTVAFPFFFIPEMDVVEALFYLPMALVFDLGIVGIFLYIVTQQKKPMHLPLPKFFKDIRVDVKHKEPKLIFLVLMLIAFGVVVFIYVKFQTLFFITIDFKNPESMFNPEASIFYSLILIAFFAVEIVSYIIRFFTHAEWVSLIKNAIFLGLCWLIINSPVEVAFKEIQGKDLSGLSSIIDTLLTGIVIFITVLIAIDFIKSLVRIIKRTIVQNAK